MKKCILVFLLFFSLFSDGVDCKAQTFVCTDMKYVGNELDPKVVQKEKNQLLGSEVELSIYDNSLRLSYMYQLKDKVENNKTRRKVIKLNMIIAYIRSFTFEMYIDNKIQGIIIFKRK